MENQSWSFAQQEFARKLFKYKDDVEGFIRRNVSYNMVVDPGDIFQNALIKAVNNQDQVRSEAATLPWFIRIAMNDFLDALRRKKVRDHVSGRIGDHHIENDEGDNEDCLYLCPDPAPNPEELMITVDLLGRMKDNLSEEEWWLIEQRLFFGKKNRQIMEETGIDEKALRIRLFRIRYKLELFGVLPPNRILGPKKIREISKPKIREAAAGG